MTRTPILLAALAFVSASGAAIKPLDGDLKPENRKSTIVFKATPQGDLKIHLYFPPAWKPADHRPAFSSSSEEVLRAAPPPSSPTWRSTSPAEGWSRRLPNTASATLTIPES